MELTALNRERTLQSFGWDLADLSKDSDVTHAETWLDWAAQVRSWGYSWPQAMDIARVWYYG